MNQKGFTMIVGVIVTVLLITVGIMAFRFVSKINPIENNNPNPTMTPVVTQALDPIGTIMIQAKDGIISNKDQYDTQTYLAETSRGFEAYLVSEGAQVTIPFTITDEQVGTYAVYLYTSDDGTFQNGDRNATIFFDQSQKLLYNHTSQDTKGMVWLPIGNVSLIPGDHYVMVTKRESTYASFSFTSIKLIPITQ